MALDLVSIIMPTFNSIEFVEETIISILNQTYENWELLICDDMSTDGTVEFIENSFKSENRIKIYSTKKNSGAAVARNISLDNALGRYIAFIDSDDIWLSTKLEKQIKFMEKNGYAVTATSYNKIDENSDNLKKDIIVKEKYDMDILLKSNVGNLTVMYDSSIIGKPRIPDIRKRNDYLYWLTIMETKKVCIYGFDEILSSYRIRVGSLSSNKIGLVKYHWIIYRTHFQLSLTKSTYLCFYWISKGVRNLLSDK
ncbi:glycosyltransferase family 2 protein [Vagococcus fluvialis]|uniref:glycosyltransferase family 2 protein n=1 Tax=Vagococcus fluvialis TaxID=2738 RepID=UPI003B5B1765